MKSRGSIDDDLAGFEFKKRRKKPDAGLRLLFRQHLPGFHWTTIETGDVSSGVPDSNYCLLGVEGWVEMKKTDHWKITTIKSTQIGWIEQRLDAGGRVHIAVRRARDELWLFRGQDIRALAAQPVNQLTPLGKWMGGPARWNWKAVAQFLLVDKT